MKTLWTRFAVLLPVSALLLWCGSCQSRVDTVLRDPQAGAALLPPVGAKSLSRHYIELLFADPTGAEAADPSRYVITAPDGEQLVVHDAVLGENRRQVMLTTDTQRAVAYQVADVAGQSTSGTGVPVGVLGFFGSSEREPLLESAISLSNTTLLLTFSEPLDKEFAEVAAYYRIQPSGDAAESIDVINAALEPDGTTVLLTTTPQLSAQYSIQVTNVKARFRCDDGDRILLADGSSGNGDGTTERAQGKVCTPLLNNVLTTDGDIAPLSLTGRRSIDRNEPLNPDAAGTAGDVATSPCGAGVGCNSGLSGGSSDEELIFNLDRAMRADRFVLALNQIVLHQEDPVLFVSSEADPSFDFVIDESEIEAAYSPTGTESGEVYFDSLKSFVDGQRIDRFKIRETRGGFCVYSLCITDGRRIDPTRNTANFSGIAATDTVPPFVASAVSTSETTVLVSFSEPLGLGADDPIHFDINPPLVVTSAQLSLFQTQVTLTTLPQTVSVPYTVTVSNVTDLAGNPIGIPNSAQFSFRGAPGTGINGDGTNLPRVVGAASTSNKSVMVVFNKPMGDSAQVASNYVIVQKNVNPEAGALLVVENACDDASDNPRDPCDDDAACPNGSCLLPATRFLGPDRTSVELTTLSQNELTYELMVVNVQDQAGNQLAPPELLVDPSRATFPGTAPGSGLFDTDNDGLTDNTEMRGWVVIIVRTDGSVFMQEVTSDPFDSDTDDDGLLDDEERLLSTNPRSADTDSDRINDFDEYNVWFSSPVHQDTDTDDIDDYLEITFYKTSPILADTDGDGVDDEEEAIQFNRNPRLADIPQPRISIGNINLQLDRRFSQTDEQGGETSQTNEMRSQLTQAETQSYETSDEETTSTTTETSKELSAGLALPPGGSLGGSISKTDSFSQGHTSTFTEGSSESTEEQYEESFGLTQSFNFSRSITETIEGANILADVTVQNTGDLAFTIDNLELSLLAPDPSDRSRFVPVASLTPQNENLDPLNLGPHGLASERGPFIFDAKNVFPVQVEQLIKDPRGVIVKLANFDLTDEAGRNFAFTAQDVNFRTAGITIDYGDGRVDQLHVATNSTFDEVGKSRGITMATALSEILGLATGDVIRDGGNGTVQSTAVGDDVQVATGSVEPNAKVIVVVAGPNGVLDTTPGGDDFVGGSGYEVTTVSRTFPELGGITKDVDILTRVDGVVSGFPGDPTNPPEGSIGLIDPRRKFWFVFSSRDLARDENFQDIVLRSGEDYSLGFVTDKDFDQVFAREEFLYGSSDLNCNTDGCPLDRCDSSSDNEGACCKTNADCINGTCLSQQCTEGTWDTLTDHEEIREGWRVDVEGKLPFQAYPDPVQPDSDGDGLLDHEEKACGLDPRSRDTDHDGVNDFDELNGYFLREADGTPIIGVPVYLGEAILDGGSGALDTSVASGDVLGPDGPRHCGDPNLDVDLICPGFDGDIDSTVNNLDLLHGDDFLAALHSGFDCVETPNRPGCASCNGGRGYATNPLNPDTDADGIRDGDEVRLSAIPDGPTANPNNPLDGGLFRDADRDGLSDALEAGWTACVNGVIVTFSSDPFSPDTEGDGLPDLIEFNLRTNPRSSDTDGDDIDDFDEFGGANTQITVVCDGSDAGSLPDETKDLSAIELQVMLDDCAAAENCHYDASSIALSRGTLTNPNEADTDGDGASDKRELDGWEVRLANGTLLDASADSDPFDPDTDDDGWNDNREYNNGVNSTLPRDADTDNDFVFDPDESTVCVGPSCLNPLRADMKIAFDYTTVSIRGNCDGGGSATSEEEWRMCLAFDNDTVGGLPCIFHANSAPMISNGIGVFNFTFGGSACSPPMIGYKVDTSSTQTVSGMAGLNTRRHILNFGSQFRVMGFVEEIDGCLITDGQFSYGSSFGTSNPIDVTDDTTITVDGTLAGRGLCVSTASCLNATVHLRYPATGSGGHFSCGPNISVSARVLLNQVGTAAAGSDPTLIPVQMDLSDQLRASTSDD